MNQHKCRTVLWLAWETMGLMGVGDQQQKFSSGVLDVGSNRATSPDLWRRGRRAAPLHTRWIGSSNITCPSNCSMFCSRAPDPAGSNAGEVRSREDPGRDGGGAVGA